MGLGNRFSYTHASMLLSLHYVQSLITCWSKSPVHARNYGGYKVQKHPAPIKHTHKLKHLTKQHFTRMNLAPKFTQFVMAIHYL